MTAGSEGKAMNDNYLWDRTGEPDAEVQELEDLLGTLRYQPRPLEIPAAINIDRRRRFVPIAIAAAIAVLMIGTGMWIRFAQSPAPINRQAGTNVRPTPESPEPAPPPQELAASIPPAEPAVKRPITRSTNRPQIVRSNYRRPESSTPKLSDQEPAQKEQVLIALRLVSAKLNLAQRKTQGLPQVNPIRNHKIG